MKKIMAVYDVDPSYADRFADFVNQRDQVPFAVMAFTSLERLRKFSEENQIEILLINAAVGAGEIRRLKAAQTVTLSDGEIVCADEEYPSIYKYQSGDSIIREVMARYCEEPAEESTAMLSAQASIIGVYSPVNRCLKTSFSLALGQLLAKDSKTLYINLEEYSGLGILMNEDYKSGLSDILYFYQQDNFNWMRLSSAVYTWGSLDYIPPVCFPEDLDLITGEGMADLLGRIARDSPYEALVVDLGQFGKRAADVLEACCTVYMPVKEDSVSAAKLEEFEEAMKAAGRERLLERVRRLKLPYHSSFGRKDNYVEQLVWGELGDYVRQMLKGQERIWER